MSKKSESAAAVPTTPPRPGKKPRNHRELGQAVFAEVNPVAVACGLLNSESEAVKIRALEAVAEWAFGSPAAPASAAAGAVRILWNVPRPAREAPAWAKIAQSQAQSPSQSPSEQGVDPREEP